HCQDKGAVGTDERTEVGGLADHARRSIDEVHVVREATTGEPGEASFADRKPSHPLACLLAKLRTSFAVTTPLIEVSIADMHPLQLRFCKAGAGKLRIRKKFSQNADVWRM